MRLSARAALLLALTPSVVFEPGCRSPQIKERLFLAYPAVASGRRFAAQGSIEPVSADEVEFDRLRQIVEGPGGGDPGRLLALADLADRIAGRSLTRDPGAALPWFRDAAVYAMFGLTATAGGHAAPELSAQAMARHNHAVLNRIRCACGHPRNVNPV